MVAADRFIIPIQASQFDVWTLEQMDALVEQASALNPDLTAYVVINRASTHPRVREADEARDLLADFPNLVLGDQVIRDRIVYRRAAAEGRAVEEFEPENTAATDETRAAYDSLIRTIDHHP